jgi:hypothetical protein
MQIEEPKSLDGTKNELFCNDLIRMAPTSLEGMLEIYINLRVSSYRK